METPHYSVVVPGYNEAENLELLFPRLYEAYKNCGHTFELIFVNNASVDNTNEVVRKFQETMPELQLIEEPRKGLGQAILTGLSKTSAPFIGIIRSDNQERPEDMVRMFRLLEESKLDIYKAIRLHRMKEGLQRVIVSFCFNLLFKLFFGLRSIDINASPKLFTRKFYEAAHLESTDFFIDAEMVIKAERLGYTVGQIGVEYLPRPKGRSSVRFKHYVEFFRNMYEWRKRDRAGDLIRT